jgi:hypothetical protein
MACVNLWIAVNEQGRGAVGLTEDDVVNALPNSNQIALSQLSVWALCGAMLRASVLSVRFKHRWTTGRARLERGSW